MRVFRWIVVGIALQSTASAQEIDFDGVCDPAPDLQYELRMDGEEAIGIEVDGSDAYLWGLITDAFPCKIGYLLKAHPTVDTLVLEYIPGSMDDDSNQIAMRMIRDAGLGTYVMSDSELYSGGTDLFLAGVVREGEPGAIFGVHSWADSSGYEARDVPRSSPEHQTYIDFFAEIGAHPDFYWFTIDAAPADGMHEMTAQELERYDFFTR